MENVAFSYVFYELFTSHAHDFCIPDMITLDPSDRRSSHLYLESTSLYQFPLHRPVRVIKHQWVSESFFRVNDIVDFTQGLIFLHIRYILCSGSGHKKSKPSLMLSDRLEMNQNPQGCTHQGHLSDAHFAHRDLSHSCQATGKVQFLLGVMILRTECLLPC